MIFLPPLLQTEPPPLPKEVNGDQATRSFAEPIEIGIKGAQCPLGTFAAVAATNGSFHGAAGEINIYKATVKPTQFSEAVIWVQHRSPAYKVDGQQMMRKIQAALIFSVQDLFKQVEILPLACV
ncbi:hypothetical protein CK203_024245 [Vitis vinifera]|uniref:Uncharacterized protein n=1 Tax=Vitis vinifera TaxID=29760 RepID=A0A438I4R6_VITVI|nr:hypothetical protein CK203_024245 [Vitis vinifera]